MKQYKVNFKIGNITITSIFTKDQIETNLHWWLSTYESFKVEKVN